MSSLYPFQYSDHLSEQKVIGQIVRHWYIYTYIGIYIIFTGGSGNVERKNISKRKKGKMSKRKMSKGKMSKGKNIEREKYRKGKISKEKNIGREKCRKHIY